MKLKQTAKGPTGLPMENRLHVFVQIDEDNVVHTSFIIHVVYMC